MHMIYVCTANIHESYLTKVKYNIIISANMNCFVFAWYVSHVSSKKKKFTFNYVTNMMICFIVLYIQPKPEALLSTLPPSCVYLLICICYFQREEKRKYVCWRGHRLYPPSGQMSPLKVEQSVWREGGESVTWWSVFDQGDANTSVLKSSPRIQMKTLSLMHKNKCTFNNLTQPY